MNSKALSMSMVFAIFAMFMVYSYVDGLESELKRKYGTSQSVLVATQDIKELDPLNEKMFETVEIPKKYTTPGYRSGKDLPSLLRDGAIAAAPILKGEQITESKITYPGTRTGLARQVSHGKRAIGIPVDDVTGAGRLIKPGDRVDLLTSFKIGKANHEREVRTFLQSIYVLAVGKNITNNLPLANVRDSSNKSTLRKLNDYTNYNTLQVEANSQQAAQLVYYLSLQQRIYAILRNNDDRDSKPVRNMHYRDLASKSSGSKPAKKSKKRRR
jgi:pilus assembly protein CpaB